MKRIAALLLISLLLFGCSRAPATEAEAINETIELPASEVALPQETLSEELAAAEEPDFGPVI